MQDSVCVHVCKCVTDLGEIAPDRSLGEVVGLWVLVACLAELSFEVAGGGPFGDDD